MFDSVLHSAHNPSVAQSQGHLEVARGPGQNFPKGPYSIYIIIITLFITKYQYWYLKNSLIIHEENTKEMNV
jgi:hypothetical protein